MGIDDEDFYFKAILEKSIIEKWWTELFPDKFKDDFNVVEQLKLDPFQNIKNLFEVQLDPNNSSSYELTCVTLREDFGVFKRGPITIDSKAHLERSLINISQNMETIIKSYFEEKEIFTTVD